MSTPSAKMWVLVGDHFACIRISGRADCNSSIDFRTLVTELRAKHYNYFVLDLKDCTLMDSTFLGVLAGFGVKMGGGQGDPDLRAIELLNPNARILELLENLGVLHLFKINQGEMALPVQGEAKECSRSTTTKEEQTLACLESHRVLAEINPENAQRFKDVTQFLAEDLKRLRADKPAF